MASGRLGSTSLESNRAGVLYTNSSGGAVSLSVMAKVKSTTANVPLSFWIDSSSTAPETTTQISSSSFQKTTDFMGLNSGNTAINFRLERGTVATSQMNTNYVDSAGTITGTSTGLNPPFSPDLSLYTGFNGFAWYGAYNSNFDNVAFYTPTAVAANVREFYNTQVRNDLSNPPNKTSSINLSYMDSGTAFDPYCKFNPVFGMNSSGYMSCGYSTSATATSSNQRTTNGLYRSQISGNDPGNNMQGQQYWSANGGVFFVTGRTNPTAFLVFYGRNTPSNGIINNVIEDTVTSAASSYPFFLHFATPYGQGNYPYDDWFKFLQYNPTTEKIYLLAGFSGSTTKIRFLELDATKAEAYTTAVQAGQKAQLGSNPQTFDTILGLDFVTDITDLSTTPAIFKDGTSLWRTIKPMRRIAPNLWRWDYYNSTTATYHTLETNDLKTNWTEITYTDNFKQTDALGATIVSTGSVTNRIVNNTSSLADSGIVEYQTSVNQYERTGLVVSNGDRIIINNGGDEILAAQAMGYEA